MARRERDLEAHSKAADKITFETELCRDLVNKYLSEVPQEKRGDVRDVLDDMILALVNLWRPNLVQEWKRDRRSLLRLIAAVFDRWEKASFERSLLIHELATNPKNTPKAITSYLDEKGIGASEAAKTKTLRLIEAQRAADRQELSRGSRAFRVPKGKADL
jgi:hypothetical protein